MTIALREDAALRLEEGACLPLRSKLGQCTACAQACPAGVLKVSMSAVELAEGCLDCGRCAAACPTQALSLEGYGFTVSPAAGARRMAIECWKVDRTRAGDAAIRVPCLGGLSPGRILEMWQAAGEAGLDLVDRGWCGKCSAGCGERHPAAGALDTARLWLEALGVQADKLPMLLSRPLPPADMPERIPGPDAVRPVSRRDFLRAATAKAGAAVERRAGVPVGGPGAPAFPANARRESAERRRVLDVLGAIAAQRGTALPDELFPRLANNGTCADHRICTAICPTGALAVRALEGGAALEFDAAQCIACGACERACPEQALSLDAHGGQQEKRIVARHQLGSCTACGSQFTAKEGGDALCASCHKSQRFLRSGAAMLRAARRTQ